MIGVPYGPTTGPRGHRRSRLSIRTAACRAKRRRRPATMISAGVRRIPDSLTERQKTVGMACGAADRTKGCLRNRFPIRIPAKRRAMVVRSAMVSAGARRMPTSPAKRRMMTAGMACGAIRRNLWSQSPIGTPMISTDNPAMPRIALMERRTMAAGVTCGTAKRMMNHHPKAMTISAGPFRRRQKATGQTTNGSMMIPAGTRSLRGILHARRMTGVMTFRPKQPPCPRSTGTWTRIRPTGRRMPKSRNASLFRGASPWRPFSRLPSCVRVASAPHGLSAIRRRNGRTTRPAARLRRRAANGAGC